MKNKLIYFDNAATSFPKPECVVTESLKCIRRYCGNPGRSGHKLSIFASEAVYSTREKIAEFFESESPDAVVLTPGATFAVNLAMRSGIKSGSHILISDMEHNSVLRAAAALKKERSIDYSVFKSSDMKADITQLIRTNTTHIVSTIASNVIGEEIDLKELSDIAKANGLSLILDASQAAGHKKLSLKSIEYDTLCSAGHKALFGMPGVGFAIFNRKILGEGIVFGGSGTNSKSTEMPENLPEHFEAGTLPLPAIVSLGAGIDFINSYGIEKIEKHLSYLSGILKSELLKFPEIDFISGNLGIIALRASNISSEELARALDDFGICVRGGFHCAPLMHKKLGTYENGAVRISLSIFNTEDEVYKFLDILEDIIIGK